MPSECTTRAILNEAGQCILTVLAYMCSVVLLLAGTGLALSLVYAITRDILTPW